MSKSPNLVWLRSFDCAARHMSFTAAAEELGITQTALSLHVRSLEAQLGCPLFFRAARNLSLTEVGQAYAFSVRRALGDIDLSTASLFGSSHKHELVVRAPISTASLFLAGRLPEFSRAHPGVSIRLVSNIWAESAGRENVDVELRLGNGEWNDGPFSKISDERIVPVAAGSRDRKWPSTEELLVKPQIQILGFQDMWHRYFSAFGTEYSPAASCFTVDTTIAAVDIVAEGGGYAVILERFARTAIKAGRSIAIVGNPIPIEQSHFLVDGQRSNANSAAKQMFETWLKQIFA
ncbi:LysR family transcriptional regulator [Ruegeria sp. HKCCD6228]|uniref:LysR family transcriptional regulator n=1 Tax=Ruegeria atlantica TaxID=81569 RepID=A0ABX1WA40_9RHOB|nr:MULTISPECIES: LysR family transcriptional regulator [Ruegeria]NOD30163.1 LysR family transcriptional regulator [Ruegeria atlantica]NOD97937.1 LysR family transcriptional regulator [Ruegeria sp. HKCCD6228]